MCIAFGRNVADRPVLVLPRLPSAAAFGTFFKTDRIKGGRVGGVDVINQLIFLGGGLAIVSILATRLSARLGAPLLLIFLVLGMLAGEDGIGGLHFSNYRLTFGVGSAALAIILFEGGLKMPRDVAKLVGLPSFSLATIGVLITAGILAVFAATIGHRSPVEGMLVGAVLASTDAAAVFMLLQGRGQAINRRVTGTLEMESGINDPVAVLLTLICLELVKHPNLDIGWLVLREFLASLIFGTAAGVLGGLLLRFLLERLTLSLGLYPVLAAAAVLTVFAGTNLIGGSGFLAVYLMGVMLASAPHRAQQVISRFLDGLAWLAQITMFLLLGLLVTPSALLADLTFALSIGLGLIFVARPLAVFLCLAPFRFNWREKAYIAWVGLRGAVPIFLASMPILAGLPHAQSYFNVAFVAVLASLIIQGWTAPRAGRWLDLLVPDQPTEDDYPDLGLGAAGERELCGIRIGKAARALSHDYGELKLPPGSQILSVIRGSLPLEGIAVQRPAIADYVIALAPAPDIVSLQRLFGARDTGAKAEPEGFGEFVFAADTPARDLALLYGLPIETLARAGATGADLDETPNLDETLGELLHRQLGKGLVIGDRLDLGDVELVVRDVHHGRVQSIGLELETRRKRLRSSRIIEWLLRHTGFHG
jgi:cell volume regulation protein A